MHLLSFRYNITEGQDLDPFLNTIQKWLKDLDINIIKSTGGEHANASSLHIHYHLEIDKVPTKKDKPILTFMKSPLQVFKKDNPTFSIDNKQLSMKYTEQNIEKNVYRFLQYPLKEDKPIFSMIFNIPDIEQMVMNAKAEYEAVCIKRQKDLEKANANLEKKKSLFKYLNSQSPKSLYQACTLALQYYRDEDDSPHPQQIIRNTETWCYKNKIWDDDDIIKRYTNIRNTDSDIFNEACKIIGNI